VESIKGFWRLWRDRKVVCSVMTETWSDMKTFYAALHTQGDVEQIRKDLLRVMQRGDRAIKYFRDVLNG